MNPTGQTSTPTVEITDSSHSINFCPPNSDDYQDFLRDGSGVYLAGCVPGTSVLEIRKLSDNTLLGTYNLTVRSRETNPTWDAYFSETPTRFINDGTWQGFSIISGGDVRVVVNPTGTARLEITDILTAFNLCRPTGGDAMAFSNGDTVHIAGCVSGTGTIEIRREANNSLARTYTVVIDAPAPTWDATLSPDPSTIILRDNGAWQQYALASGGRVNIIANPSGTPIVEITKFSTSGNLCSAEPNDPATIANGDNVYLAGCPPGGGGSVELRREVNNSLIRTYSVTVQRTPTSVCNRVTNLAVSRTSGSSVYITWTNPASGGLTATGRQIEISKWVSGAWVHERVINELTHNTYAWHLGIDAASYYAYRMRSVCGSVFSNYATWLTVLPYSSGSSGASGAQTPPTPTPTPLPGPSGAVGTGEPAQGTKKDGENPPNLK